MNDKEIKKYSRMAADAVADDEQELVDDTNDSVATPVKKPARKRIFPLRPGDIKKARERRLRENS